MRQVWLTLHPEASDMSHKVFYIHPVHLADASFLDELLEFVRGESNPEVEVSAVSLPKGPLHLRYRYYGALVLADVLKLINEADEGGFHASIIGCFFDIGLQEAREIVRNMAVIGPCQASVNIASTLCDRFSIIVGSRKGIPQITENLRSYGAHDRLASFRAIEMPVLELHQKRDEVKNRLRAAGKAAVEQDGAEALILGCTAAFGLEDVS